VRGDKEMITTRYVREKVPPPQADLVKAIEAYHQVLEERRVNHNLLFAPLYRPFLWAKEEVNPLVKI
jgi:hypothetical protein